MSRWLMNAETDIFANMQIEVSSQDALMNRQFSETKKISIYFDWLFIEFNHS